jgi:phage terminase large subunit-like protein
MICEWLTMLMEEQGVEISGVYFDRWRAREFFKAADDKGFATLAHREGVGQGYQSMSPRLEAFETALLQKRLKLDNHPCMNMALAAAIAVSDPSGNRKITKSREHGPKVDPLVAALMAVYPCVHKPEEMGSDLSFWVA